MTTEILHTGKWQVSAPPAKAQENLSANGVADVDRYYTAMNGTSATVKLTLANGRIKGQIKEFYCVNATNAVEVTPASFTGGTKIAFSTGGVAVLQWDGAAWVAIKLLSATVS